MSTQVVIPGRFDDAPVPRFTAEDPAWFTKGCRAFAGKRAELVLRAPKSKRSLDQNSYAHRWPFALIAEAMGESVEAAKLCILGEKFGWVEVRGHLIPAKPSTSALTVAEFDELIEWMVPFGAQTFGIVIPLPRECM